MEDEYRKRQRYQENDGNTESNNQRRKKQKEDNLDDYGKLALQYYIKSKDKQTCNHYMLNDNVINTSFKVLPASDDSNNKISVYSEATEKDFRSFIRQAFECSTQRKKWFFVVQYILHSIKLKKPVFINQIKEDLHARVGLNERNFIGDFNFLLERVSTAIFCGVLKVPLGCINKPGFYNEWLRNVPTTRDKK